jgi:hypothetical protein
MLNKVLLITGSVLMAAFITMVCLDNKAGWQFLTPAIIILALGGLAHDLSHPKPRRTTEDATERPLKRKKRRVKVPAGY